MKKFERQFVPLREITMYELSVCMVMLTSINPDDRGHPLIACAALDEIEWAALDINGVGRHWQKIADGTPRTLVSMDEAQLNAHRKFISESTGCELKEA